MRDRVIAISGGSEGIGFGMATHLASRGAKIATASRDAEKGQAAAGRIGRLADCDAAHVACVSADIGSESDNERMVAFAVEQFGRFGDPLRDAGAAPEFLLSGSSAFVDGGMCL